MPSSVSKINSNRINNSVVYLGKEKTQYLTMVSTLILFTLAWRYWNTLKLSIT